MLEFLLLVILMEKSFHTATSHGIVRVQEKKRKSCGEVRHKLVRNRTK